MSSRRIFKGLISFIKLLHSFRNLAKFHLICVLIRKTEHVAYGSLLSKVRLRIAKTMSETGSY